MKREFFINLIEKHLNVHSTSALLGPRQCGKTTLARMYADQLSSPVHFLDMENPYDLAKLEKPMLYLGH